VVCCDSGWMFLLTEARKRGSLHFTALLTTLVPPTRELCSQLRRPTDRTERSVLFFWCGGQTKEEEGEEESVPSGDVVRIIMGRGLHSKDRGGGEHESRIRMCAHTITTQLQLPFVESAANPGVLEADRASVQVRRSPAQRCPSVVEACD
jgi:hypothetical protein